MDEQDGSLEAALDVAQEAQHGGDLGDGVQAHQGVEDDEAGRDALHRFDQALAVGAVIEAQRGHVDDGDVERPVTPHPAVTPSAIHMAGWALADPDRGSEKRGGNSLVAMFQARDRRRPGAWQGRFRCGPRSPSLLQGPLFIDGCKPLTVPKIAKVPLLPAVGKKRGPEDGNALPSVPAKTVVGDAVGAVLA